MKKIFLLPLNFKEKTSFLIDQIEKTNILDNFVYITSNFCKLHDFKFKFFKKLKKSTLPQMFTLKSLALKLIYEKSPKRVISDIEKYIIILEIIKKERKINQAYTDEGLAKIISNFIKEFKISSLNFSDIKKIISEFQCKFDNNKKNLEFALDIFEKYENLLDKNNIIDLEDIYDEGENYIEKEYFKNIVFENILEFPKYQRNFIKKLVNLSENVFISYFEPSHFSPDTRELIIDDTLKFLNEITTWEIEKVKGEQNEIILECFNFSNKEEEIKGIINLIGEELKKNKEITFDDIIITCPNMLDYRNYIKRIFSRFNLPIELIPGYSFINESSISPIFEFFIFSDTYDWNSLMNILTSPYFTKINKKEVETFSKISREKFENTGFYKEDFEKLLDNNLKIIKECIDLIDNGKKKLEEWKNILENILEKTGWQPSELEIKFEFERLIKKMSGSYYLTKEEFINLMKKLLEMIEVEEGKGEGIRVSGIIESLGIEKKICFFCGATEENFPNSPKIEEFLLPDKIKKDLGIDYFEKRVARDRSDFYRIKNEHEKVIFTYPSKIEDRLQMKSIFIFDMEPKHPFFQQFLIPPKEIFKVKIDIEKFESMYLKENKFVIRVTDLESLLKCPYKFYLKNVEKIEPYQIPQIRETPDLWGKIIHESFKETFENEKNKPIEEKKLKEYKDRFESLIFQKIEDYFKKERISSIYKNIVNLRTNEVLNKFEQIIKECFGTIFLNFEKDIEFKNDKIKLKGRVDILGEKENEIIIIDIKTGTSTEFYYTENDFMNNKNIQLPLYIWIYHKEKNIPYQKIKGEIWNFSFIEEKNNFIKSYDFSNNKKFGYMEKIEEFLNQITHDILERKFQFIPENNKCEYICEYKELCIYGK
ncbi:MAG: PD-(D/E)XK nuclease family protein [Candidatus Omnitrophica bacterium]|nr:PD-(D/E)XK nuclease family protein [Candidatus Omnitrophota bacterium]